MKSKLLILALAVTSVFLLTTAQSSFAQQQQQGNPSVCTFFVYDYQGQLCAGAYVALLQNRVIKFSGTTGLTGKCVLFNVPSGYYDVYGFFQGNCSTEYRYIDSWGTYEIHLPQYSTDCPLQ